MYYESKLITLGSDKDFLIARHFPHHKVGGEITRETAHARFLFGNLNTPTQLTDVTPLCTLPRPASKLEAKRLTTQALQQDALAASGDYSASYSTHLKQCALQARHAAALALQPGVHVPRMLLPAENGRILLGFVIDSEQDFGPPELRLRLIDLTKHELLYEYRSSEHPSAPAFERFVALSADARHLALPQLIDRQLGANVLSCIEGFTSVGRLRLGDSLLHLIGLRDAWLGMGDKQLWLVDDTLQTTFSAKLPRSAQSWTAQATADGSTIALATDRGGFCVFHPPVTKPRLFNPHRGVRPADFQQLALSPCGQWVASRVREQLTLISLQSGNAWPLARLSNSQTTDSASEQTRNACTLPPAFGFVGNVLLTATGESFDVAAYDLEKPSETRVLVAEQGRPGARKPLKIKRDSSVPAMLEQADLASIAEPLQTFCSPALCLRTKPLKKAGWLSADRPKAPALGESRFGGWPDLPAETPWPTWQDRPMAFLGQIDLATAQAAQPGLKLPAQGLLSFFIGCSDQRMGEDGAFIADVLLGSDPAHRGAWRVIHSPDVALLQRRPCTLSPPPESFEPCSVSLHNSTRQLPEADSPAIASLALTPDLMDNYQDLLAAIGGAEEPQDQLMGYPQLLQYTPPEWLCSRAARGEDPWQLVGETDSHYQSEMRQAADWTLLLQLTSNPHPGFCWGDGGQLFFVGPRAEMAVGDFSNVWLSFEN